MEVEEEEEEYIACAVFVLLFIRSVGLYTNVVHMVGVHMLFIWWCFSLLSDDRHGWYIWCACHSTGVFSLFLFWFYITGVLCST